MAQIYWLLNTPGFHLEHCQWIEIGNGIYLGQEAVITTADSVVDDQTVIEFTLWIKGQITKSWQIRAGEVIDLSFFGIDAELWPVAAIVSSTGRILKMMLGLSLNRGGSHELSKKDF